MLPAAAPPCPGFCARTPLYNASQLWTECGACSWGSGSMSSQCVPCQSPISLYQWMYLAFMVLLPLFVHCFCVHYYTSKNTSRIHVVAELLCCVMECLVSSVVAILLFPPRGTLYLWGCGTTHLKQWYPALFNPIINHVKSMKCTYEIVFPLYSLPFVFLLCLLISILLFRSILYCFVLKKRRDAKAYYYALLTLPKVAIGHALLAGIVYHSFPYIAILVSLCSNSIHLAMEKKKSIRAMLKRLVTSPQHIVLLTINMALLSFAIIALLGPRGFTQSLFSLLLVPIPPIFYVVTISFTHPSVLSEF